MIKLEKNYHTEGMSANSYTFSILFLIYFCASMSQVYTTKSDET